MTLTPGIRLGPYEILAPIGAGGMGEVYRARDPRVGREVAIKVSAERFNERFEREARAVAALNHPNICTLHDVGPDYIVMELVEGQTLADRINRGAIPLEEALQIAWQIVDALEAAHEKGIIHRDLKPANIKIRPDGTVKVLDFGLAKVAETQDASLSDSPTLSHLATQQGIILGTAGYMSPEQARGKQVDKRADIWSFGVVFYEMLTGKRLFEGDTVSDTLAAVLTKEPDWHRIPAKAWPLLRSCLEKDPRRRLRDIGDAWRQFANAPEQIPKHRPWVAWGVAAMFLIAFLLVSLVHFREQAPPAATVRFQILPPEKTSFPGNQMFSLSPDGRRLAFYAIGADGAKRIWVRPLDSLEATPLPGTETASGSPFFWSFDSRFVVFGTERNLQMVEVSGGRTRTLCNISGIVVGGSWNPDGVIIFGTFNGGLMQVSQAGGVASVLTTPNRERREAGHCYPTFLSDGRNFLYLCRSEIPENSGIYLGSLDDKPGKAASRLLLATSLGAAYVPSLDSGSGQLLFMREGMLWSQVFDERRLELAYDPPQEIAPVGSYSGQGFFSVSTNGTLVYKSPKSAQNYQLTWVDRQGKVLSRTGEPGDYTNVVLSPDERQAAIACTDLQGTNLSLFNFSRQILTPFTFGGTNGPSAVWSPDSSRIIFRSMRSGVYEIYRKPAGSGAKEGTVLLKSDQNKTPTSWSRDGRFLLFSSADPKTSLDLWVLPLESEPKPVSILHTEFNERNGQFSTDGRWIAYVSNESGSDEVWVMPFLPSSISAVSESEGKWMVSKGGGSEPRWRRDGKELFYWAPDGKMMSVEIIAGPDFQSGTPRLLFQLPLSPRGWDVTEDGKRFLFVMPNEQGTPAPFNVILNWQAGLKK